MVVVDFYYSAPCESCKPPKEVMEEIQEYYAINYSEIVIINIKEVSNATNRQEMRDRGLSFPVAIVNNETKIPKNNITFYEVQTIIDAYLQDIEINQTFDERIIDIPFIGRINTSSLSLPVLTIVLGVVDSFNVCSIFILFILLSLLVHAQSRKRMLLVGGIFVFFSGLWYLIFMFVLQMVFSAFEMTIISIVVGVIAIVLGVITIKDFFFFKRGVSIGIPEKKKSGIYRQMRNLVKTPYVSVVVFGTIVLAVTVNLLELVCSFILPTLFVSRLGNSGLSNFYQHLYILAYNVIYVIPLIIIVLLFAFSLGRMKLTDWQGQKLKLFSGIMISSFGILLLVDYMILENVVAPVALLLLSIILTTIISHIWKKYSHKEKIDLKEESKEEKQ